MKTVLLADDSKFMRLWLTRILSTANFTVIGEAENGVEAIEKFDFFKPDILIMDINMPEMDGLTALRYIIESDSSANVVICSSMGQQPIIIECLRLGARDFIVKPYFNNMVHILQKLV